MYQKLWIFHLVSWILTQRRGFGDRVENESELLNAFESTATPARNAKWDEKMEAAFINNIGRCRRYTFDSARDLLRAIRNKSHHYRELPREITELLGSRPEGFESYI
ncbi:hypothetical protein OIU77_026242 [Salix suchowensis]|uniref:KEN domain-containing protein n=1 Tax=Salix suchowensis TaxID=1278906 RepID=A0ABQ9BZS8_9ROSI|nr:hypothetical protein OIU77_026242 [Salix suchowensis]